MPRAKKSRPKALVRANVATAVDLLKPIIAFLKASGTQQAVVRRALEISWGDTGHSRRKVAIGSLRKSQIYGDIVGIWRREPQYLDKHGNARSLPLSGKASFAELVAAIDPDVDPKEVALNLERFGNIEVTRNGRVRLLTDFFHVRNATSLAFEPSAQFLSDVAASVNSSLSKRHQPGNSGPFWRMAEARDLPVRLSKEYERFAKERSLQFLQEIDDWLIRHGTPPGSKSRSVRAGIGVFAILPSRGSTM